MKTWQEAFKRMQDRGIKFQSANDDGFSACNTNTRICEFSLSYILDYRIDPTQTPPADWREIYKEAQDNGVRFICGGEDIGKCNFEFTFNNYKISGFEPEITRIPPLDITITLTSNADEQFKADIEAAKAALAERNKHDPYRHLKDVLVAGKRIRLKYHDGRLSEYMGSSAKWSLTYPPECYEIEPDTKRIDWSKMPDDVMVNSPSWDVLYHVGGGMFSDAPSATGRNPVLVSGVESGIKLAPDQPWVVWFGGECPVPEGVIVEVVDRDGDIERSVSSSRYRWTHDGNCGDIIAYRITGIADGWTE